MNEAPQVLEKIKPPIQVSRTAAYSKAATHFYEAFDTILNVMRTSTNPSDRLGAARTIVNKVIADVKSVEITGGVDKDGNAIPISAFAFVFGTEYDPLSRSKPIIATSEASALRESTAIQDADLAPQGTQDHHSNLPDGTASTP